MNKNDPVDEPLCRKRRTFHYFLKLNCKQRPNDTLELHWTVAKRQQICLSIFISFLTMIIDALSLIMIYEFISTLEQQSAYVSLKRINDLIGLKLPDYEVSIWAIYVGLIVILANFSRVKYQLIINITFDCERKINEIVFQRKILGSYTRFITENQFDDQKEILNEATLVVVQGIMSVTYIFLGLFQIIGIMVGLTFTDPKVPSFCSLLFH